MFFLLFVPYVILYKTGDAQLHVLSAVPPMCYLTYNRWYTVVFSLLLDHVSSYIEHVVYSHVLTLMFDPCVIMYRTCDVQLCALSAVRSTCHLI